MSESGSSTGTDNIYASVGNAIFQWDASTLVGFSDGDPVTSWADEISSHTLSNSDADQQPRFVASGNADAINSKAVVRFDGDDSNTDIADQLFSPSDFPSQAFSSEVTQFMILTNETTNTDNNTAPFATHYATSGNPSFNFFTNQSGQIKAFINTDNGYLGFLAVSPPKNVPLLVVLRYDAIGGTNNVNLVVYEQDGTT